jgi:DNA-binding NarL/FixJ family response regulator
MIEAIGMPIGEAPHHAVTGRARVLAVDDQSAFLVLLRQVVGATRHLQIVGEALCGELAVEAARDLHPDMVLMDVRMPGIGGVGAAELIKSGRPSTVVVLISTMHPDELPEHAVRGVADAVMWKSELEPSLLDEIWLRCCDPRPE